MNARFLPFTTRLKDTAYLTLTVFLHPLIVKVVVSKKLKSFVALGSSCLSGSTMNRMSCK